MDLSKKIGQLFIIGFEGSVICDSDTIVRDICDYNLGGVILFNKLLAKKMDSNNIISAKQVQELCTSLQEYAHSKLFISIDQEGGMVSRLPASRGFTETSSAKTIGNKNDLDFTTEQAEVTTRTLKKLGINLNFGPVVDLDIDETNPIISKYQRSFSGDPTCVVNHARSWISVFNDSNILSCLKHFPGHGSSTRDSHHGFVDITNTWDNKELLPYEVLISENNVDLIMTGHLYNKSIDPLWPATLSEETITKLLRTDLGYQGVVVSDDMQMGAIAKQYGFEIAIQQAVKAGVDIIILGNNLLYDPDVLKKGVIAIEKGVKSGVIPIERINEAYTKIQRLKAKHIV